MFRWLKEWGEEVKNRFVAVVPGYFGGDWSTEGYLTDPLANVLLFDTGSLPAGIYDFQMFIAVSATFATTRSRVEHRSASNTATLHDMRLTALASRIEEFNVSLHKMDEGERLRCVNLLDFTGGVQVVCIHTRRFPLKRGQ